MTTTIIHANGGSTSAAEKPKWFNLRRKRCWAIIALLFYTLLGFFAVSAIIKTKLIDLVEENLGRSAHIQAVLFNPYELSLRIQQFEMRDTDGVKLAAFDDFFVNFQLSSLFRWALTFREIRLDNSYVYYERFDAFDSRISRILADAAKNNPLSPEKVDEDAEDGLPRLLIHDFQLNDGRVNVRDNVPSTPVDIHFGPINVAIKELNTLPGRYGQQGVNISLPDNGSLQWQGNLSLTPLDFQGELILKDSNMAVTTAYLKALLPLEAVQARLSSSFKYHVQLNDNGVLDVDIDNLDIELDEVAVAGLTPSTDFFALQQLALHGGTVSYPEQLVEFASLRFTEPQMTVWRKADGSLSVNDLIATAQVEESAPREKAKQAESESLAKMQMPAQADVKTEIDDQAKGVAEIESENQVARPWQFNLNELALEKGRFDFSDYSVKPAAQVGIHDLQINATDISNQHGAKIPLNVTANFTKGGNFAVDAMLEILPEFSFAGKTKTRGIPLSLAQPYVQQFSRIMVEKGAFNSDMAITMSVVKPLTVSGTLQIPGLELKDTLESKRLLAWKNLSVERLNLDLGADKLELSPLQFEELFGRIIIYKDKSTNLSGLVVESDQASAEKEIEKETVDTKSHGSFDVVIGGVSIKQSGLDFSDLSLPLPFATQIKDLNGTVSTIASNSSESANIKLEGQVDDYGLSRINGSINLLDPLHRTDISVEFRNLLMSSLSPYTVQFAGREIAEGKLDLDLNYDIDKSQLQASNKVVISDLQLGKAVDHPDAASLPLGLAVALLKDANGVIDINLPIEGDIDDPEFRIGGIIWQTFAGLIVKAVTSPFRLLAGLIGVDSDDLGEFQFLAGRADLTPPELEKVAQLKQALMQRPKLSVEISGGFDPKIDTAALKYSALRRALILKKSDENGELSDIDILDERLFKPLKVLFDEHFPDISLKSIRNANKKPPVDDPEGRLELDELAYAADLRDRLLETVVITEENLIALAQARAEAIKEAFLADEFDVSRIEMAEPEKVESKDGHWVKFELGVTAR